MAILTEEEILKLKTMLADAYIQGYQRGLATDPKSAPELRHRDLQVFIGEEMDLPCQPETQDQPSPPSPETK